MLTAFCLQRRCSNEVTYSKQNFKRFVGCLEAAKHIIDVEPMGVLKSVIFRISNRVLGTGDVDGGLNQGHRQVETQTGIDK